MNPRARSHTLGVTWLRKPVAMILLFFGMVFSVVLWNDSQQPRYQGHTMEWWLNKFTVTTGGVLSHESRLSPEQEQAVKAFQYFGKEGFDYLAKQLGMPPSKISNIKLQLLQYKWIRDTGLIRTSSNAGGALVLLRHLKVPYRWVEPYWAPTGTNAWHSINLRLNLVHSVTNQLDRLVPKVTSYLTHTNQVIRQSAIPALNHCYEQGHSYPEIEPILIGYQPSNWAMLPYLEIISKHAFHSSWAQQTLRDATDHPELSISALATTAMTTIPSMRNEGIERIKKWIEKSIQRAEKHPNHMLSFPWLTAFDTKDLILDDSLKSPLLELAQHAYERNFFQILDIFERQSWQEPEPLVSLVRQKMEPKDYMGYYEFQAFFWLLDRDPEDSETWKAFDRALAKDRQINQPHIIRWLSEMSHPSKAAEERLLKYSNSDHEPSRIAAEETLAKLKKKDLLVKKPSH